jgi:hypothetical protein
LSCGAASQLALHDSSLRLEGDRELLFQDGGQIRSFDDTHKLVFNRPSNLLELHERGSIRFLTGGPTPSEKVRISADGRVGIGTETPEAMLHIAGDLRIDNSVGVMGTATVGGDVRVSGAANVRGNLQVEGNVGIGTTSPNTKLDVAGNLQILTGSNPIRFTAGWTGFPDAVANQAEISNDTGGFQTLMIVGNQSAGVGRRVSVWDRLEVNGTFITTGNIGIGTSIDAAFTLEPLDASPNAGYIRFGDNTGWKLHFGRSRENTILTGAPLNTGTTGVLMTLQDNGNVGIGTINPQHPIHMRGGAFCDGGRIWRNASSIAYKTDIAPLELTTAFETLAGLTPVTFRYKEEEENAIHVGFIAEDVPALVASRDRKGLSALEIVGILTMIVQHQQQEITSLRRDHAKA